MSRCGHPRRITDNAVRPRLGEQSKAANIPFPVFQAVEQTVVLPQDFAAATVKLEMIGNNGSPVEAEFVWAVK